MNTMKQHLIASFKDIVCCHSDIIATQLLEAAGWELEEAIGLFYRQNEAKEFRNRVVWEGDQSVEPANTSQINLASLYRPPIDLIHFGSFQQARHDAHGQDKWLIVNVQSHKEFNSHELDRDLWANDAVAETIKANFVFWQIYEDVTEGKNVCNLYNLDKFPAVLVIDPITGQKLRSWNGAVEPEGFLEDLYSYVDSAPKASLTRKSSRGPSSSSYTAQPSSSSSHKMNSQINAACKSSGTAVQDCEVDKGIVQTLASLNMQNEVKSTDDKEMVADVHKKEKLPEKTYVNPKVSWSSVVKLNIQTEEEKRVYPNLPEEPTTGGDVCRVGIRLPCGRRVRRSFLKTDSTKLLWSFCCTLLAEEDCLRSFHFTQGRALASDDVKYDCDSTFEESGLSNTLISLVWD